MRVWVKVKNDSGIRNINETKNGMQIPHSINIATALYGFLQLIFSIL